MKKTVCVLKKAKWPAALLIILLVILLFPIRRGLPDGGSVEYRALLYSYVRWEFFAGDGLPNPEHKIVRHQFYAAPLHWMKSIGERQSDLAEELGCFAYRVKTIEGLGTRYIRTINGYLTNDWVHESAEDGGMRQAAAAPFTLEEIRTVRRYLEDGTYDLTKNTDDIPRKIGGQNVIAEEDVLSEEETIYLLRVSLEGYEGKIIPVKMIDSWYRYGDGQTAEVPAHTLVNLLNLSVVSYDEVMRPAGT